MISTRVRCWCLEDRCCLTSRRQPLHSVLVACAFSAIGCYGFHHRRLQPPPCTSHLQPHTSPVLAGVPSAAFLVSPSSRAPSWALPAYMYMFVSYRDHTGGTTIHCSCFVRASSVGVTAFSRLYRELSKSHQHFASDGSSS